MPDENQRILITGATGFLGKILLEELRKTDFSPITLSRSNSDYNYDLSEQVPIFNEAIDFVLHISGKAHSTPSTTREKEEFYNVNFLGTKNLIEGIQQSGSLPEALIYASSVSVYGCDQGTKIDEEQELSGNSPYADSKRKAEEFLINWGKEKGVLIGILRLPLIAGPNPPGNLGAMIEGIKSGKYYRIRGNEAKKSLVNGKDIINILEPLFAKGGIYNLSDGYHPNVYELEEVISKSLGKKIQSIPSFIARGVAKVGDMIGPKFPLNSGLLNKLTSTLTFSDQKARNNLGWNPTPVLDYLSENIK